MSHSGQSLARVSALCEGCGRTRLKKCPKSPGITHGSLLGSRLTHCYRCSVTITTVLVICGKLNTSIRSRCLMIPTPLRVRMHEVQQDTTTILQMSEVTYNVDLPDALFDPQRLRTTVVSPLRQPYRAQAQRHVSEVQAIPNANSAPGAVRDK